MYLPAKRRIFANGGVKIFYHIVRQVVATHLNGFNLINGDFLAQLHRLYYAHNLCFFADALIEQRRDRKANNEGKDDAEHADHGSILQKIHREWPSLFSK